MQNGFSRRRKRRGAIISAVVVCLYGIPFLLLMLWLVKESVQNGIAWTALLILLFYGVTGGALIAGVLLALRQRLREIDGGEEDDAKRY